MSEIDSRVAAIRAGYAQRIPVLKQVARNLEDLLAELLDGQPRVERVSARVKAIDRFVDKALKMDSGTNTYKYRDPLAEIQDQIGARIIVYYRSDVDVTTRSIMRELREIESMRMEPVTPEQFSYEAQHLVCFIPPDIRARLQPPIDFFEVQIGTLFQHAWAEANHDLGYKPHEELGRDERRRLAWAAAQSWGADVIFDELWIRRSEVGPNGWRVYRWPSASDESSK